jgi:hypothetical protein
MPNSKVSRAGLVDNTTAVRELRPAVRWIADLVFNFAGPDDGMISVQAGELRRLLKAASKLDTHVTVSS